MKSLFQFAVILALVVLGWFIYPTIEEFLRSQDLLPAAEADTGKEPPEETGEVEETPAEPEPVAVTPPAPQPEPEPEPEPAPAPAVDDDKIAALIPMPTIPSLEDITSDWTDVPEKAFPPKITTKDDIDFTLAGDNRMKLSAGRELIPVDVNLDGQLVVTPRRGSALKASVPMEKTNFKELVTQRYEEGVARILADVERRREEERQRLTVAATVPETRKAEAGEVPKTQSDEERYIALMKASLAAGELEGVTPSQVKAWRWLGYEERDGTGYWTGAAVVTKSTYFGDFETEARALIRHGKVEKWLLPGVEE